MSTETVGCNRSLLQSCMFHVTISVIDFFRDSECSPPPLFLSGRSFNKLNDIKNCQNIFSLTQYLCLNSEDNRKVTEVAVESTVRYQETKHSVSATKPPQNQPFHHLY